MLAGMHLARNHADPDFRTRGAFGGPHMVAFTSEHAHYSYLKAAFLTGTAVRNWVLLFVSSHWRTAISDCFGCDFTAPSPQLLWPAWHWHACMRVGLHYTIWQPCYSQADPLASPVTSCTVQHTLGWHCNVVDTAITAATMRGYGGAVNLCAWPCIVRRRHADSVSSIGIVCPGHGSWFLQGWGQIT